jgi:hypothetical protein
MTKSWDPSRGKQLPGEQLRENAETGHTSPQPSRHVRRKGAAPLSGAEEQTARTISAYAQCACVLVLKVLDRGAQAVARGGARRASQVYQQT